jgi:hypothetical protein
MGHNTDYTNEQTVDFIVEGLDDHGEHSGRFLEVTRALLVDGETGERLGEFTRASELTDYLLGYRGRRALWLIALETVGEPLLGCLGRYVCDEQRPFTCRHTDEEG